MSSNEWMNQLNDPRLRAKIKEIASSPQGRELMKQISASDKEKIMQQVQRLNKNNLTAEMLLQQLNNNPGIVAQLSKFLK